MSKLLEKLFGRGNARTYPIKTIGDFGDHKCGEFCTDNPSGRHCDHLIPVREPAGRNKTLCQIGGSFSDQSPRSRERISPLYAETGRPGYRGGETITYRKIESDSTARRRGEPAKFCRVESGTTPRRSGPASFRVIGSSSD